MKRWTNGLPGAAKRLDAMMAIRGLSGSQPGCARIPMMARSNIAPLKRPDTLMQLSRSPARHSTLHRAAGPYIMALSGRSVRCGNSAANGGEADAMRALCFGLSFDPKPTLNEPLLDHLVGKREQGGRDFEAERLGRPEVQHKLEFSGLHDRQVGRLLAL